MRSAVKVSAAVLWLSAALALAGCGSPALPRALPGTPDADALPGTPAGASLTRVAVSHGERTVRIGGPVPVSLSVPADWVLQGTVFVDGGRKVAELSPGAARMPLPDTCSLWPAPDPADDPTRILQQSQVTLGALDGIRRVEEAPVQEGGTMGVWYPVAYCLQEGDSGLYITFYGTGAQPPSPTAFDAIAATAMFGT